MEFSEYPETLQKYIKHDCMVFNESSIEFSKTWYLDSNLHILNVDLTKGKRSCVMRSLNTDYAIERSDVERVVCVHNHPGGSKDASDPDILNHARDVDLLGHFNKTIDSLIFYSGKIHNYNNTYAELKKDMEYPFVCSNKSVFVRTKIGLRYLRKEEKDVTFLYEDWDRVVFACNDDLEYVKDLYHEVFDTVMFYNKRIKRTEIY